MYFCHSNTTGGTGRCRLTWVMSRFLTAVVFVCLPLATLASPVNPGGGGGDHSCHPMPAPCLAVSPHNYSHHPSLNHHAIVLKLTALQNNNSDCANVLLETGCAYFYPACIGQEGNSIKTACTRYTTRQVSECFSQFPQLSENSFQQILLAEVENLENCSEPPPDLPYDLAYAAEEFLGGLTVDTDEVQEENSFRKMCESSDYFVYFDRDKVCAPRCDREVYFTNDDKKLAFTWLCIWTSLCILACSFTVLTYLLQNGGRFDYPERPVIYISFSCLIYAFGHLLREFTGLVGVGCMDIQYANAPGGGGGHSPNSYYLTQSLDGQVWCTFTFILIYYSHMAIHVWWLVLSLAWFLAAVLQWSQEALDAVSVYFHLISWLAPAAKVLVVLVTRRFAGDPLTGLCLVGAHNRLNLAVFIIIPISIYLCAGTVLSAAAFLSLLRIRTTLSDHPNLRKLEKLMLRIALFALCYIVPCFCYLLTCIVEYSAMPGWTKTALERSPDQPHLVQSIPSTPLLILKLTLTFFIGIATSVWTFNWKTISTWRECLCQPYSYAGYASSAKSQYKYPKPPAGDAPATRLVQYKTKKCAVSSHVPPPPPPQGRPVRLELTQQAGTPSNKSSRNDQHFSINL